VTRACHSYAREGRGRCGLNSVAARTSWGEALPLPFVAARSIVEKGVGARRDEYDELLISELAGIEMAECPLVH
jgi:hypothetical protein